VVTRGNEAISQLEDLNLHTDLQVAIATLKVASARKVWHRRQALSRDPYLRFQRSRGDAQGAHIRFLHSWNRVIHDRKLKLKLNHNKRSATLGIRLDRS